MGESIFLHTCSQSHSYSPPHAPFLSSFVFIQTSKSDWRSPHLDKLATFPAKCSINLHLTLFSRGSNKRKHFSNLWDYVWCGIYVCKPFIFFFSSNLTMKLALQEGSCFLQKCAMSKQLHAGGENNLICLTAFLQWLTLLLRAPVYRLQFQFQKGTQDLENVYQDLRQG